MEQRFASAWGTVLHGIQLQAIQRAIRLYNARDVLEIAPGPARLSCQVTGFERGCLCDVNVEMLRVARDRLKEACRSGQRTPKDGTWQLIKGDAFNLPFGRAFDMIYTFRFIRHFERQEREIVYREIHSCLNAGGVLVFDAVNASVALPLRRNASQAEYPIYDELYDPDVLAKEISQQGFDIISLFPVMRHIVLQQLIQVYLGPRSYPLAKWLIQILELIPGQPLEWIVICRKRARSGL